MARTNTSIDIDSSAISIAVVALQNMDSTGNSIKYFQRLLQRFGVVYMAIVIILGFIGNSISCYVFVRSKLKYDENLIQKYL
jgi:predicted tellurium resistance membrane protein TerC